MNIEVKLFFGLGKYVSAAAKESKVCISLEENATIQEVLDRLAIPAQEHKVILVNGIKPKVGAKLKEGDVVAIFPPMAGG